MGDARRRHPAQVLRAMDGWATWEDLGRLCTQHAVRMAVARGSIVRTRRGLYALPGLPTDRQAAADLGGVLSHLSAAVHLGLDVLVAPDRIHVTVPRGGPHHGPDGVVLHRRDVAAMDRTRTATRPLRTVLDCAVSLPFAEALAVADSALREGLLGAADLALGAAEWPGPAQARVRRVASQADGDAANPLESALRAAVLGARITGFVPQQPVRLASGRTVLVDLGDPERRIALEADSFAHHGSRQALRDDCRRYDELVRAGWVVLRFAWEHFVLDPGWVAMVVSEVVARRDLTEAA